MNAPENQLTTREERIAEPSGINLRNMQEVADFAQKAVASRLLPKDLQTPEAAFIAISMGMELGLKPMQALQSIAVINGRPCIWGDAALAIVKAHPECEDVIETFEGKGEEDEGITAVCEVRRRGKVPVKRKFTVKMAKTAGLWNKAGPWTLYKTRMLQMRARSWALRDAFPDALKGIGVREEVQDIPARAHLVERPAKALTLPGGETIETEAPKALTAPEEPARQAVDEEEERGEDGNFKF